MKTQEIFTRYDESNHVMTNNHVQASLEAPTTDDRLIWETWLSALYLPTVTVADELGLFPFIAATPATADEVAAHFSLGARGTEAVLGLLAALGYLVQRQGRFSLTDPARNYLLPDSPYYIGGSGILNFLRDHPMGHARLRETLEKEKRSFQADKLDSSLESSILDRWKVGDLPAHLAAWMIPIMHSHSFPAAMGVARYGDFNGMHKLLDVGGGSGCFCIALALRHPHMRFTVLELKEVAKLTAQYVAKYEVQDQVDTLTANMFTDPWPHDCDGVLFANVFHDWDRLSCLHLARRSFEALPPGGRIYLHETLLNDTKDGPVVAAAFSMNMLPGLGKQYTAAELAELLREAGFVDVSVISTYAYYSLVSARKPA